MSDVNAHSGHRARMRERYLKSGFDSFQDHEILEIILYNCYTRRNTNDIAHKLLDKFGSISAVLEAPLDSLVEAGVSETVAVTLRMIPDICRIYYDDRNKSKNKILTLSSMGEYFLNKFIGRVDECLYLLLLDSKEKEVFCGIVSEGSVSSSNVPVRKIVDFALRYNATIAVIAHNHPSGVALPSKADLYVTDVLYRTLATVGVRLVDHIIVADDEFISLRAARLSEALIIGEN